MWTIRRIEEDDFGCEERGEDEPLRVLVTLVSGDGREKTIRTEDEKLRKAGLDEGSLWPEEDGAN